MPKFEREGWFDAVVVGQSIDRNPKTGSVSIKFTLEIAAAEAGGEPEHAYYDAWLTPKAKDKTLENLGKTFGYSGGIAGLVTANWVGEPVRILAEAETYNEQTSVKVKVMTAPGAGGASFGYHAPDPALIADIARELGDDPPAGAPAQTAPAPAAGNAADDLPF